MEKYGNNFSGGRQSLNAGKVPVWLRVDESYPAGCTFNNATKGTTIPVGTAVYVSKMGGEATILDNTATAEALVTGLLLEDVVISADSIGATGTIVTRGQILTKRGAELSAAVKANLASRISFVEE